MRSPQIRRSRGDWPLPGRNQPRTETEPKRWIDEAVRDLNTQLYQEWKGPQRTRPPHSFSLETTPVVCAILPIRLPVIQGPANAQTHPGPGMWLPHGGFHHVYHRGVACIECHQQAVGSTQSSEFSCPMSKTVKSATALQNCRRAPSRRGSPHLHQLSQVHNGDQPRAGLGAAARSPKRPKKSAGLFG